MNKKYQVPLLASVALLGGISAGLVGLASAQTPTTTSATASTQTVQGDRMQHVKPTAMGSVTAINGTSLTITDKINSTTYTIEAANAAVTTGRDTASTLSSVKVGDMVAVEGTLSGTTITATALHTGEMGHGGPGFGGGRGKGGIMGTVASINGNTVTVTDKNGGTYTVDASAATVKASGATSSLSNVKVGDTVMIQGKITTASMTATQIEDGLPTPPTTTATPTVTQ